MVEAIPVKERTYHGETIALADLPDYAKFYAKLEAGRWEPHTFEVLRRQLTPDTVYIDIGAWIGVTPCWASRIAKRVIAVEPDPRCREILKSLLPRYPNVTLIEAALSSVPQVRINAVDGFGSSETSVLQIGDGEAAEVPGISVDRLLEIAGPGPKFVKIDIEGYEYALATELARLVGHDVFGVQCAVHPQLLELSLAGPAPWRRLRGILATIRLHGALKSVCPIAAIRKFHGLTHYIRAGLATAKPVATDMVFLCPTSRT